MSRCRKICAAYLEPLTLVVFIGIFSLLIPVLNQFSIKEGFFFFLFQVFAVLVPGLALVLLLHIRKLSRIELVALAYALGYCLNLVMYYLFVPFGLKRFLWAGFLVLFAVSGYILWNRRKQIEECERDLPGWILCGIIAAAAVFVELLTICTSNAFPPRVSENVIFNDMMYWIGNTISLTKEYPIYNFRKYPQYPYTYHFFSSMQLAAVSIATGIRPIILSFGYSFLQPVLLITLGAYSLFCRMLTRSVWKRYLLPAAMFAVFFTEGCVDLTKISYTLHLLIAPFGFDIGMGLFLFFWLILVIQLKEKQFQGKLLLLSVLFFSACLGSKSPFGAMALLAMGAACLVWLFRRQFKKAFLYGIPILASFGLLYLFVVNLGSSDQPESSIVQTFLNDTAHIYRMSGFLQVQHDRWMALCSLEFLQPVWNLLFIPFAMIVSNYMIYVPFFFFLFIRIWYLKKWDLLDSLLVITAFVGAGITMNWGNPDFSVAYFMMTTYMTSIAFILRTVQMLAEDGKYFTGIRSAALIGMGAVLLLLSFREAVVSDNTIGDRSRRGWTALVRPEEITADRDARDYISADDYAACEWIRLNTPEDTVMTGNKGLQLGRNDNSRHTRVTGVFSERFVVTNDDSDALFFDLDFGRIAALKELGVSYILYNTTATEGFVLPEEYGEIVYWNDTNVLYRLR